MPPAWSRTVLALLILPGSLGCLGCAHVPAYQRGKLAQPTMQPGYAGSVGRDHMQAVQEGASGGDADTASGCGCN